MEIRKIQYRVISQEETEEGEGEQDGESDGDGADGG